MKVSESIADIKSMPFFSQFTDEQLRTQISRNISGVEEMRNRAIKTGKNVGGFSVSHLTEMVNSYKTILK
jgi:hypothetical protein